MKTILAWLNSALSDTDYGSARTYYRVKDAIISASNGNMVACHPWPYSGDFLVPGIEFERIIKRLTGEPTITAVGSEIKIRAGRFSGTLQTIPLDGHDYAFGQSIVWKQLPRELPFLLQALQPFTSTDAMHSALQCITIEDGWLFATNSIALAGAKCAGLKGINMLLPPWAIDFLLNRLDGLEEWAHADNYAAFRWSSGAWMRTQLVIGKFPEKASAMVKQSIKEKPTQRISDDLREALTIVGELAEDTIKIYADRICSRFGKAIIEESVQSEVPKGADCSIWGARFLLPALLAAECWSPACWPAPTPWKGPLISGYVIGRRDS